MFDIGITPHVQGPHNGRDWLKLRNGITPHVRDHGPVVVLLRGNWGSLPHVQGPRWQGV